MMRLKILIALMVCGMLKASAFAHTPPPTLYAVEAQPSAVNDSGGNDDDDGGGYATPHVNQANIHLQHQQRIYNSKPAMAGSKTSTFHLPPSSASASATVAEAISASTAEIPMPLHSAYVYSAPVPTQSHQPEANKVVNAVKLASSTAAAMSAALSSSTHSGSTRVPDDDNAEMYVNLSKKNIGSSSPLPVALVLNGNEPEFTDALGQKVPKPLPSLQVASPIDLLNPDRYEFYTFDDNGELVKRLMTMEEIQSIVANGDGEGPTIIHHGPVDDRDPEKNVQDIVNSVQNVLNKEVEINKNSNSTTNILPVLDTPDVSSSWAMILPAIFGNTGGVDMFAHQKPPQQIVMTPDTEIIETSTKQPKTTTTKKPKPNKRKPGQKRKPSSTTTTTEVTPQVIQEELESHESVYTGMQQYQHLAATMHNYDGISQLNMQPIYQKLPEPTQQMETTTKRVYVNNDELIQKPPKKEENNVNVNHGKKPVAVQPKPVPPHRVKKPSSGQTTTKRPQSTKQKIKRKPTTTTTSTSVRPETTTNAEIIASTSEHHSIGSTSTSTQVPEVVAINSSTEPITTTSSSPHSSVTPPKKKKKKPTRQPIKGSSNKPRPTVVDQSTPSLNLHNKANSTHPPQNVGTGSDLIAEGTAHQEISHNTNQHVSSYHRPRPKPQKPTMAPVSESTLVFAPIPVSSVPTPQNPTLIVEDFPGLKPNKNSSVWNKITTEKPTLSTMSTTTRSSISLGTSGYPVPAYALEEADSEEFIGNTSIPIRHDESPHSDQDIHALESFDQIVQSLKQPEVASKKPIPNPEISTIPSKPINPVKYDSAETFDQLEELANKHKVVVNTYTSSVPTTTTTTTTLKPLYTVDEDGSTWSPVLSDLKASTVSDSEESTTTIVLTVTTEEPEQLLATTLPSSLNDFTMADNQKEEIENIETNTYESTEKDLDETSMSSRQVESTTESIENSDAVSVTDKTREGPEISVIDLLFSTVSQPFETMDTSTESWPKDTTAMYEQNEATNNPIALFEEEETTVLPKDQQSRLPVASPPAPSNKDTIHDDDDLDGNNQAILVADLKPQLNMEVLKPSEQISMSDFQTQAATVASTLVDGNLASDYNILNSNETKDEIALLMSDVIKQISSNSDNILSNSEHTTTEQKPTILAGSDASLTQPEQNNDESQGYLGFMPAHSDHRFSNFAKLNATFFAPIYSQNKVLQNELKKIEDGHKLGAEEEEPIEQESIETTTAALETSPANREDDATIEATTELHAISHNDKIPITSNESLSSEEVATAITSINDEFSSEEKTTSIPEILESETKDYSIELSVSNSFSESNQKNSASILHEYNAHSATTLPISGDFTKQQTESVESLDNNEKAALFEADYSPDITTEISSKGSQDLQSLDKDEDTENSQDQLNTVTARTDSSESDLEVPESTPKIDIEDTTLISVDDSDLKRFTSTATEAAPLREDDSIQDDKNWDNNEFQENTTLKNEESTESSEQSKGDNIPNASHLELESITETPAENDVKEATNIQENLTLMQEEDMERTTTNATPEDLENTTTKFNMSEETSEELHSMISEEDETDELIDGDPYVKLGETTTTSRTTVVATTTTPITLENIKLKTKLTASEITEPVKDDDETKKHEESSSDDQILNAPKPISIATESIENENLESNLFKDDKDSEQNSFEGADVEDEEDQQGYQTPAASSSTPSTSTSKSTSTSTTSTTTTAKPTATTTRRLNTLKPVSYFNKQPAYALFPDSVEPLYNKPLAANQGPEIIPNKINDKIAYTIPSPPQQRPMQRPPQLSNLMIASTQATRPPVKLEPSPANSKGLEASLINLDEDILAFSRLCNELAFSYWKSITSEKISSTRSLVLSPFALTSMLSMVFLGARGSTSGEMNDVLKLDDMITFNPHLIFKNITESVEKATDTDIATTAFVREIFSDRANGKILQFFKEKTQQFYSGHVEEVNFHVVNDIIRRRTNLLIKRHTMGKVLEYLRTNSVWVNGPLATISANLFQTDCSQGSTHERDGEIFFQVHPTVRQRRLVPIPAVLFKSGFTAGYEPNLEATIVAFGRIQDTTSMIYVMPGHHHSLSPSDNLDRLEKDLMNTAITKNAWSNLLTSLMDRPGMEVQLPRFSHRSFVNASLGLQKMGLKGLFKSDFADLGGLTGSSNRDIFLSDMIQINTFSTCGEEKIADHHHVEMYPAPPLRKRNKDVEAHQDDDFDSSEAIIDFGSLVQDSALGRGFYDDLLDPKYLELPLPLRPRQARVPDAPRLRLDKPFLYFVRHNPTGMILFMGRFNPRLLP